MDEPVEAGGTDQGAMPGMVLLASLAGCKGMVTRLYCSKYNIPLHSCEIVLTATGNLNQSTGEIHQLFEIEMNVDADHRCPWNHKKAFLKFFDNFVDYNRLILLIIDIILK